MSLIKNTSCSIEAAAVLLACRPEVIEMALENRDLVDVLYKRIVFLEQQIADRDELVFKHCEELKQKISQKYPNE
jgi:hypothetical protein